MQPTVDWGQIWSIVGSGLVAVFFIMTLLATATHFMGKIFQHAEKRKKEKAKTAQKAKAEGAEA